MILSRFFSNGSACKPDQRCSFTPKEANFKSHQNNQENFSSQNLVINSNFEGSKSLIHFYNFSSFNNDLSLYQSEKQSYSPKKADKAVQTSLSSVPAKKFDFKKLRWLICLCDWIINISKYYCMDSPQALQTYFSKGELHLSNIQYNHFYSIISYFFLVIFYSGYFIERYGVRFSCFFYAVLCFIGHGFFTFGGNNENYYLMLLGRLIFVFSSFCLDVCQDIIMTEWFFNQELSFALGMRFTTCRIGSALTIYLTPKVMINGNYYQALSIGLWLSIVAILCALVIAFIDRNFEEHKGDLENFESFLKDFPFIENGINFKALKDLGLFFWLIVLNIMFIYACYFGFVNNSNDILCNMYGITPQEAGEFVTIMYFSASLSPIFGIINDKIGRRIDLMIVLLFFLSIPFVIFCFSSNEFSKAFIGINLIFIGVFFSSYVSTIWSLVPLLLEPKKQSLAFSIFCTSISISLLMASIFVGISTDILGGHLNDKYEGSFICMISCIIICLILILIIRCKDNKTVLALNSLNQHHEIRNIINDDPNIGQELLEIIDNNEGDSDSTIILK